MARTWTAEQKARQAALIRSWKPWEQSTGPRTAEGKVVASQNRKKSLDQAWRELMAAQAKVQKLVPKAYETRVVPYVME
jgi:hypothetical protein